ncbi:MAG: Rieske (2Fe-2S) protein [Armatimonadetes bacterium]|nr:Rieske (2Fe-2S) protein [Armatimonadota bacterium]
MNEHVNAPADGDGTMPAPTRRTFVRVLTGMAGAAYVAALGYPVYKYLGTAADEALQEASVKEVALDAAHLPLNAALMFKFAGRPAMLIHHSDDTWSAYSAICTHLGCTVAYEPERGRIHCACHGGVYDARSGRNVSGPPPKPLTPFQTSVVEGKVVVSRA